MMSLRWAARYAFSEDLWRSRARVVLDPALEDALLAGLPVGEDAEPLRDLVDALLPARGDGGPDVWMAVRDHDVAARLGRLRPGTRFVALDRLPSLCAEVAWEAALIDLDAAARLGRGEDIAAASLAGLALPTDAARNVVVWAAAGEAGLDYEALAEAMMEQLWSKGVTQRIYGLYQPPMAAVVDFGESLEVDDAASDLEITLTVHPSELRGEAEDDDVPLYFDNSLGAQEPGLDLLLGVCSSAALPEGLGLVELPAAAAGQPSGLRAQLASAQARAQRAEVERQTLLDRLDALQRENRELREKVEAGPDPFDALARDEALEASMAREQALKWKVSGLEHQLSQAIARPVEALEAEVARLSARDDAEEAAPAEAPDDEGAASDAEPESADVPAEADTLGPAEVEPQAAAVPTEPDTLDPGGAVSGAFEVPDEALPDPREPAADAEAVVLLVKDEARDQVLSSQLRRLVQRLERGGIGVLALRRELGTIARRLRTR